MPKPESTAEIRYLEASEINLLAEAIDHRYSAMVLTAAYTGLRFSELRALRVDRFEALRRIVRVSSSLVESRGQFYFDEPKSEASRRTVRVPPFLVEVLAAHLATYADGSGLIFSAPHGGPIRRSNFRRRIWLPAVEASVGPPCTFHDLRHSHAVADEEKDIFRITGGNNTGGRFPFGFAVAEADERDDQHQCQNNTDFS